MSHKQNDNYMESFMDFDWVDLKRYGPPDESGVYLCAFSDNTIETCCFWGKDDMFWSDSDDKPKKWRKVHVTHWCPIEPEWHPDYDPSPESQEDVTRIGGWG